jgi:hypothetical protein
MTETNFYSQMKLESDTEFQNDCLVFTLFNTHIQTQFGTNQLDSIYRTRSKFQRKV